jgi:hypothetical protein
MTSNKDKHYVNNEQLYQEIVKFQAAVKQAELEGKPEPQVTNYIGECIIKIATKFAYRPNFINYTYRDEMIADGIEACLLGVKKFDVERFSNPFAYFTQSCYFAFIHRIKTEKKQAFIKSEIIKENALDSFDLNEFDGDEDFKNSYIEFLQSNMNVDGSFLQKKEKKKVEDEVPAPTGLEDIFNE